MAEEKEGAQPLADEERRSGNDRRSDEDRRQDNDPNYRSPERRDGEERRSGGRSAESKSIICIKRVELNCMHICRGFAWTKKAACTALFRYFPYQKLQCDN